MTASPLKNWTELDPQATVCSMERMKKLWPKINKDVVQNYLGAVNWN